MVDSDKNEPSNKPKYVKNSRFLTKFESSDSESSDSDNSNSNYSSENDTSSTLSDISGSMLEKFISHIPGGAQIIIEGKKIQVTNTCSIDYFLLAFWFLYKSIDRFINNIPVHENSSIFKEIILLIDNKKWNMAKEVWITQIMKVSKDPKSKKISMFGAIDEKLVLIS